MKFFDFLKPMFKTSEPKGAIPRDNPFQGIARGLAESVDRLPAPMVIILVIAATVSILAGVVMELSARARDSEDVYLPLRVEVNEQKPAIATATLRGMWVYTDIVQTMSIRFGVDTFELMQARKDETYSRYYVRGGYRTEGNILILQSRKDLGSPNYPDHPELKFIPMELPVLNIETEAAKGIMLWRIPQSERDKFAPSVIDDFPFTDTRPMGFVKVSDK